MTLIRFMEKLGYDHQVLYFCTKRTCGLWFMIIGAVTILAAEFGGSLYMSPGIFILGYFVGFFLCYGNRKLIFDRLAQGAQAPFQKAMSNVAFMILGLLCFLVGLLSWHMQDFRITWLLLFFAVGVHFFPFYFVHGKLLPILGTMCCASALAGLLLPSLPFLLFACIDGALKLGFGVYLLFFSGVTDDGGAFYAAQYRRS